MFEPSAPMVRPGEDPQASRAAEQAFIEACCKEGLIEREAEAEEAQKTEALAANDFSKVKHLQANIQTLKKTRESPKVSASVAAQIAALEAKQAEAIAAKAFGQRRNWRPKSRP